MKTRKIYYLLMISIFALACGDDKDESPSPVVEDTAVYFRCKLDGKNYTDDARFADYIFGTSRVVSQNNEEIILLEMNKDTTGTFVISTGNDGNNMVYVDSLDNAYKSIKGTIVVTEFSKSKQIISGTFSAELVNEKDATDKIIVSEGKFNRVMLEPF